MRTLRKLGITVGLIISVSASAQNSFTVHKFGFAPDFDTGDGAVTIWDGADDSFDPSPMEYVYESSATISNISCDTTDTVDISVQGLDANSNLITQVVTLNGTNSVQLTTPLYRVFRAYNAGSTALTGYVYIYPNTPLTAGYPTDLSKIRALMSPSNQQTEMAMLTIPKDHKGKLKNIQFSIATGIGTAADYTVSLWKREPGGVFRLQHKALIDEDINGQYEISFDEPIEFVEGTDIELRAATSGTTRSMVGSFEIELERIRYY